MRYAQWAFLSSYLFLWQHLLFLWASQHLMVLCTKPKNIWCSYGLANGCFSSFRLIFIVDSVLFCFLFSSHVFFFISHVSCWFVHPLNIDCSGCCDKHNSSWRQDSGKQQDQANWHQSIVIGGHPAHSQWRVHVLPFPRYSSWRLASHFNTIHSLKNSKYLSCTASIPLDALLSVLCTALHVSCQSQVCLCF